MKYDKNTILVIAVVCALLVGVLLGHFIWTKTLIKTEIKEVTKSCPTQVCPECQVCLEPDAETFCKDKVKIVEKEISCSSNSPSSNSPNKDLVDTYAKDNKNARVISVQMKCSDWEKRETDSGRLVDLCYLGKRTIVHQEELRPSWCSIVSIPNC